ncbi:MAG: DUF4340 domain-containing protein [Planctomycetota bacterium]|nr:DUF4340 domain-containing protein [Planctomycetota bacterium]
MNWRTTVLLALTALVITPLAYRSVQDARPQYVVSAAQPFSFAIAAVETVDIERGEDRISIEKATNGWDITAPVVDRGRYAAIEDLLHLIRDLEIRGEGPDDPARTGLDSPSIIVKISTPSRRYQLELGSDHPSLPRVYAAVDQRPVLISSQIRDALRDFHLDEIRDDAVCGVSPGRIQRVMLERPDQDRIELVREGPHWKMVAPFPADANPEAVENWLTRIAGWAAVDYIDGSLSEPLGLDSPAAILTVELRNQEVKTVAIGDLADSRISGTVAVRCSGRESVLIAAGQVAQELLSMRAASLISPFLVRIEQPRVEALTLTGGAYSKVDLQLDPAGGWAMRWGGDRSMVPADATLVGWWVERLRQLRASDWIQVDRSALQQWGFDRPLLQIALVTSRGDPERIIFGDEVTGTAGDRFAWNPRCESLGVVKMDGLDDLVRAPFSLRDPHVTSMTSGELRRFRIGTAGGAALLAMPRDTWRCQGEEQLQLPQPDVRLMARRLSQLIASRWMPDDEAAPGPDHYLLKAELFSVTGTEPEVTLYFGDLGVDGARRARIGNWVFSLAPTDGPDLVHFCEQFLEQLQEQRREEGRR